MIEPVSAPLQILASYTKVNDLRGEVEIHRYVSVNGSLPRHTVEYMMYNSAGQIEQGGKPPTVDIKA